MKNVPIHEDKVLKKHPKAKEFRPVKRGWGNGIYGWIFQVPRENGVGLHHGFVTFDGEVSSDLVIHEDRARANLKVYVRSRPNSKPVSDL